MEDEQERTAELEAGDIDSLKKSLEEGKAKAERYLSNWQRAEADFDNYRKRVEQERSERDKFANMVLILNLLPVLDDLGRAFSSLPAKLSELTWIDGIRLIYRKLQATLEAQGLSEVKTMGETFDPAVHDAVTQGEGEEGKIIEELQKGYKLHDRVVRPALVVVGRGKEGEKKAEEPSSKDQGG